MATQIATYNLDTQTPFFIENDLFFARFRSTGNAIEAFIPLISLLVCVFTGTI
ncbi:MAG: hypothetical protein OXM61_15770 [Candidatus Poribacteria bacterium]|nr:hypothetical protein [Candidatus Poribacteria bacterium]